MADTQFYTDGMNKLLLRYQKCIHQNHVVIIWKNKDHHTLSLRIFWQVLDAERLFSDGTAMTFVTSLIPGII